MVEAVEEDIEDPEAGMGIGFDPGRMEDLGSEVATERRQMGP